MVVADDHSYVVQPRPQHPDEVIVWEMDERTLPLGVTDGRGEQRASMHYCTLHPASPLPLPYTSTFHLVSLVTIHLDLDSILILSSHLMHSSHSPLTNPTPFPSPDIILTPSPPLTPALLPSSSPHTSPTPLSLPSCTLSLLL